MKEAWGRIHMVLMDLVRDLWWSTPNRTSLSEEQERALNSEIERMMKSFDLHMNAAIDIAVAASGNSAKS